LGSRDGIPVEGLSGGNGCGELGVSASNNLSFAFDIQPHYVLNKNQNFFTKINNLAALGIRSHNGQV
jgi:hypothetical protein